MSEKNPGLQKVGFLLLGKTGCGKSALGNSILKYKAFRSSSSGSSVTQRVSCQWVQYGHYDIHVIDGPGLEDTNLSREDDRKRAIENIMTIFTDYPENITTFLFAFKYANRFTNEDNETLMSLKQILGDTFLRSYGIIVITCGDMLEGHIEDGDINSFEGWKLNEIAQKSGIGLLIEECQGRCVLFNNREKTPSKQNQQLDKLIEFATPMQQRCAPYHNTLFKEMSEKHQRFIVESKAPELKEKYSKFTSLLMADASDLEKYPNVEGMDRALERIQDLLKDIEKEDMKTKVLKDCEDELLKVKVKLEHLKINFNSMSRSTITSELSEIQKMSNSAREKVAEAPSRSSWWTIGGSILTGALLVGSAVLTGGASLAMAAGAGVAASTVAHTVRKS